MNNNVTLNDSDFLNWFVGFYSLSFGNGMLNLIFKLKKTLEKKMFFNLDLGESCT
jgi:hypothetical protein